MRIRHLFAAFVVVVTAMGCSAGGSSRPIPSSTNGSLGPDSTRAEPGRVTTGARACGGTKLRHGNPPAWANAGPSFLRYAISDQENAAAYLFADPLKAGQRTDERNNKILWVVREPRNNQDLNVRAQLGSKTVTHSFPANSGPGEIYPSIVDVPTPGCWHFVLTWNGNRATFDLSYE